MLANNGSDFYCSRCMSDMFPFNHIDYDFEFKSSIFNYFCDFLMFTRFMPNDQQFSLLNNIKVTKDDDIDPDSNVYNDDDSKYYLPCEVKVAIDKLNIGNEFSVLHINAHS